MDTETKITTIEKEIRLLVKQKCREHFHTSWYGAYDIDPKHLVYWICVQTDNEKHFLEADTHLYDSLRALLVKHDYPQKARDAVYIGFESQETVDRESGGNWYHHFK